MPPYVSKLDASDLYKKLIYFNDFTISTEENKNMPEADKKEILCNLLSQIVPDKFKSRKDLNFKTLQIEKIFINDLTLISGRLSGIPVDVVTTKSIAEYLIECLKINLTAKNFITAIKISYEYNNSKIFYKFINLIVENHIHTRFFPIWIQSQTEENNKFLLYLGAYFNYFQNMFSHYILYGKKTDINIEETVKLAKNYFEIYEKFFDILLENQEHWISYNVIGNNSIEDFNNNFIKMINSSMFSNNEPNIKSFKNYIQMFSKKYLNFYIKYIFYLVKKIDGSISDSKSDNIINLINYFEDGDFEHKKIISEYIECILMFATHRGIKKMLLSTNWPSIFKEIYSNDKERFKNSYFNIYENLLSPIRYNDYYKKVFHEIIHINIKLDVIPKDKLINIFKIVIYNDTTLNVDLESNFKTILYYYEMYKTHSHMFDQNSISYFYDKITLSNIPDFKFYNSLKVYSIFINKVNLFAKFIYKNKRSLMFKIFEEELKNEDFLNYILNECKDFKLFIINKIMKEMKESGQNINLEDLKKKIKGEISINELIHIYSVEPESAMELMDSVNNNIINILI